MNELYIVITGLAGLIALAILSHIIGFFRKKSVLRYTLADEIGQLVTQAQELKLYLSQEGHDWLKPGQVLSEAPIHLKIETKIYFGSLKRLHLLGGGEMKRVVAFYTANENIQRLVEILFARISQAEARGQALHDKAVQLTKLRIRRILQGLDAICRAADSGRVKLKLLPESYELPAAKDYSAATAGIIGKKD
ncbi:MAG: hypothetical protein EHM28_12100 [Spirochaetaceae bacterium]|nr:MAG: hypothetical protein EHM28_12100 [Spirochaetaceae bacterium]